MKMDDAAIKDIDVVSTGSLGAIQRRVRLPNTKTR
jgi:hypothetical protein